MASIGLTPQGSKFKSPGATPASTKRGRRTVKTKDFGDDFLTDNSIGGTNKMVKIVH
jgi:hypothetical protein